MKLQKYLIAFLLFSFALHATNKHSKITADPKVNIEISNIVTNGLVLPNNTISFNGVEDLEIEFDVKASYTGTNTKYFEGILNCYYYEPNSFDNEIAQYYDNGVAPQYLFQNAAKLQYSNGTYIYTNRQKLRFKRSTVYNTGCSIVFRYRTEALTTDISNKLTYKITGGTKTGSETSKASTANITLTNLSSSDGLPLLINNKIIVPEKEGEEIGTRSIDLSFDFNCTYGSKLINGYYPGAIVQIADNLSVKANLTEWITPIVTNGTLTFKNLKIKSSDISATSYLKIRFKFQEKEINLNCALVSGYTGKPILQNIIGNNQTVTPGGTAKPFTFNDSPYVDFTIPCNYRGCAVKYDYRYINTFKWQIRTQNSNWSDISNATSKEYSPSTTFFKENTYYRRIAFYDSEQYNISNTISITLSDMNLQNSICCDQNLPLPTSQPQEITGNISNVANTTYQWQICVEPTSAAPVWKDIPSATNSNYKHIFTEAAMRGTNITGFRRLLKSNSLVISTSNQTNISRSTSTPRSTLRVPKIETEENLLIENINIYPNPIINSFFVEGPIDINNVSIYDSFGIRLNIEKYQKSKDLIEINTSKLQSGIFLLKIDNTSFSKTLIKN